MAGNPAPSAAAVADLLAEIGSRREIIVDPERLGEVAASLRLAHRALEQSPAYTRLEAGDVRGRLPEAVDEFTTKNEKPRTEILEQLDAVAGVLRYGAESFANTENSLVRALGGGDRS